MIYSPERAICENCNEILPRAAAGRCPFCRVLIATAEQAFVVICRRCNAPIPRSGANDCPSCQPWRLHRPQPGQEGGVRS
jgi:primosomal protein N'